MTTTINAVASTGLVQTSDGSGIIKVQSNGVTTNALAWVNWSGATSPGTIRSAYNVSSVTRTATGAYTLNFTTAMSDANYCAVGCNSDSTLTTGSGARAMNPLTFSTSSLAVVLTAGTGAAENNNQLSIAIFGN